MKTGRWREPLYVVLALLLCTIVFQLFFRYQYVRVTPYTVLRVDRLTQRSCTFTVKATSPLECGYTPTQEPTVPPRFMFP